MARKGDKMKLGSRRTAMRRAWGTAVVCLLGGLLANGQAPPEQPPRMAEQVFKNIQVLKGIPVNQFMATMGFFSASVGMNCTDCHGLESAGNWEKYADDTAIKRTARAMIG